MTEMIEKAKQLNTKQIKKWILENVENFEIGLVFDVMLEALRQKTTESEFVDFCNKL